MKLSDTHHCILHVVLFAAWCIGAGLLLAYAATTP